MDKVRKRVVHDAYDTTFNSITESQKNNVLNRYMIRYSDIYRVKKVNMNNTTYHAPRDRVFISLRVNPLANKTKFDTFKSSEVYGKFKPIKYYSDNNISHIAIFIDGVKVSHHREILLKDNYVYIEVDDKGINTVEVIVFNMKVKMYDAFNEQPLDDEVTHSKLLAFRDGLFDTEYNLVSNVIFTKSSPIEIIQVIERQTIKFNDSGQSIIKYDKINKALTGVNVFNFNGGKLSQTTNIKYDFICDGFMRANQQLYGYAVIIWNPLIHEEYKTYLDTYASYKDIYRDYINGTVHNNILNYKPYEIYNVNLNNYDTCFKNLINHDREIYSKFLDGLKVNNLFIKYSELPKEYKNIRNNSKWIEHDFQLMEFYTDRVLLTFKVGKNRMFNIFYNGELLTHDNMYFMYNNSICHCFIDTSKLKDIESSLFEIEMCDFKIYDKITKIASYTGECHVCIDSMLSTDTKYLRCYINGRLINSGNIKILKPDDSSSTYKVLFRCKVEVGDMMTVEIYGDEIKTIYTSETINNNILKLNKSILKYPLSVKYYDIYINGKKVIDDFNLTTCTIKINDLVTNKNLIIQEKPTMISLDKTYQTTYQVAKDRWNEIVDYYGVNQFMTPDDIIVSEDNLYTNIYDLYKIYHQPLFEYYLKYNTVRAEDFIQDQRFIENFTPIAIDNKTHLVIKLDASIEQLNDMTMVDRYEKGYNIHIQDSNNKGIIQSEEFLNPNDDLLFDDEIIIDAGRIIDEHKRMPEELIVGNGYHYIIEESESE